MISDCRATERHWRWKTFESLLTAEIYVAPATYLYLYSPTWLCGVEAPKIAENVYKLLVVNVWRRGAFLSSLLNRSHDTVMVQVF